MSLIRDILFSNFRPKFIDEPIDLPGGGQVVIRVRTLTADQYFEIQRACPTVADVKKGKGEAPDKGDEDKLDSNSMTFLTIMKSFTDPTTGEPVFLPSDLKAIQSELEWKRCLMSLVKAMDKVNGEVPDVKKPSPGTPSTEAG